MKMYSISIIIPVCNAEKHIDKCIANVYQQSFSNFELILVESGSTDNSEKICREYAAIYDNLKFIALEKRGVSFARNKGLREAQGEYVLFVDADDYMHEKMLEELYLITQATGAEIACCNYYAVKTAKQISLNSITEDTREFINRILNRDEGLSFYALYNKLVWPIWNKLYSKKLLTDNNICFPEDKNSGEDNIFNFLAYLNCNTSYFTDKPYYYYVNRLDSLGALRTFSLKLTKEWYEAGHSLYNSVLKLDESLCNVSAKNKLTKNVMNNAIHFYLNYQYKCYTALIYSERIDYERPHFFWGAGDIGLGYANTEDRFKELYFVDNDEKKSGKDILGYPVISPNKLKEKFTGRSKIIITSEHILEIFLQLKEMGIVECLADVMIYDGETKWDRLFVDCLSLYLENNSIV